MIENFHRPTNSAAPAPAVRRGAHIEGDPLELDLSLINLRRCGIAAYTRGRNPTAGFTVRRKIATEYLAQVFWRNHKFPPSPSVISPCTVPGKDPTWHFIA